MSEDDAVDDVVLEEGYRRGTAEFDVVLRTRKVERCRESRSVTTCRDCDVSMFCELLRLHLMDLRYGVPKSGHR